MVKEITLIWFTLVFGCILHLSLCDTEIEEYYKKRDGLLEKAKKESLGSQLNLTPDEEIVNGILLSYKNEELDNGFENPEEFWAGKHFFDARIHIEESKVFKFIQKLPKGAQLHIHDTASASDDYLFSNISYRNNLYAKENFSNGQITLKFFKEDPGSLWDLVTELRANDSNFDDRLKQQFTLFTDNRNVINADTNDMWKLFGGMFGNLQPLMTYKPVFRDYFYEALKEHYEDNIRYIEIRGVLPELYDLEGEVYGKEETLKIYYDTTQKFIEDYPDFWGVKFIVAPNRNLNSSELENYLDFIIRMDKIYPNFIGGFDLVAQEDIGQPLKDLIPSLLKAKNISRLIFHAGETLWNGENPDENLIDAVLLNTHRIGHAYAIVKHPEVLEIVREKKIGLEICPISNQVLGLVRDLRNHPANFLIANNYPVVIASDDPGFWGAKALSYDWYMALMAMSSRHADLRLLKQLALNSIEYSSMDGEMKEKSLKQWNSSWDTFLNNVIKDSFKTINN